MKLEDAKAALERAGYVIEGAEGAPFAPGLPGLFNVAGLGRDLTEGQLIQLAHRHGTWQPAFKGAHSIQASPPR